MEAELKPAGNGLARSKQVRISDAAYEKLEIIAFIMGTKPFEELENIIERRADDYQAHIRRITEERRAAAEKKGGVA